VVPTARGSLNQRAFDNRKRGNYRVEARRIGADRERVSRRPVNRLNFHTIMAQRQIAPERKAIYYLGMAVGVIGFLFFISTFFTAAANFGDFSNFAERSRSTFSRAVIGMILMIVAGLMTRLGRAGLAGSGLKLDPEEARRDLEPWARMGGGIAKDALDEAGINLGGRTSGDKLPFDERLRRLQQLRQEGVINEQEYEATKQKILASA